MKGCIVGGFAFSSAGGLTLYGTSRDGVLECLAVVPSTLKKPHDLELLAGWMAAHDVHLVDWIAAKRFEPGDLFKLNHS
ncbi:MAG: hypothetical protein QM765_35780 [Myxococcales bacterium]